MNEDRFNKHSEDHPEQIHLDLHDVEEKDMQYLTIGIVVNAPYGTELNIWSNSNRWWILSLLWW